MGNGRAARRKVAKAMGQPTNAQLQMSLLNMRQMYEGAVAEKIQLQQEVERVNALLSGVIFPDEYAFISDESIELLERGAVIGMKIDRESDGLRIELVFPEGEADDESEEE